MKNLSSNDYLIISAIMFIVGLFFMFYSKFRIRVEAKNELFSMSEQFEEYKKTRDRKIIVDFNKRRSEWLKHNKRIFTDNDPWE